jgi:MerR family transcriptional regulator/heat shock protein HspR
MPPLPLDDENLPLFTVGQVSTMLEIQQAFLRRLDEFRVVRPSRSPGGQRRYTRREINVVQYVLELVNEGMTLPGIRRVLELEAQARQLAVDRQRLAAERDSLRAERDELLRQRDEAARRCEALSAQYAELAARYDGLARRTRPS